MKNFSELIEDQLTEGWGASGQKRELERHKAEWDTLLAKYANQDSKLKKLKDLKSKNWKAEYAEKKL